jgi:hypothetical protein
MGASFLMGGRANGRSAGAFRYVVFRLLGEGNSRGAIMRELREDIRTSSLPISYTRSSTNIAYESEN